MFSLDNLNKRLHYRGGNQEQRFQKDKLTSLKRALIYSYQACSIQVPDGNFFRCLMNRDVLNYKGDEKILSIPYKDFALNDTEKQWGEIYNNLKLGDTIYWVETNTHWLIFLEYEEEDSYFRAKTKKCNGEITINDTTYHYYKGDLLSETLQWREKNKISFNETTYNTKIYITQTEDTYKTFQKGNIIKIKDNDFSGYKKWQVIGRNDNYGQGLFEIYLEEYYENTIEDKMKEKPIPPIPYSPIEGNRTVNIYSTEVYKINGYTNGEWKLTYNNEVIQTEIDTTGEIKIQFLKYKHLPYILQYITEDNIFTVEINMIKS